MKLLDTLANAFPVWVLVACGLALVRPELFTWFRGGAIVVGLAVIMTTCTTLAAVILTPLLTKFLAGRLVEVDAFGLFLSTLQVVVLPVVAGMAVNRWLPGVVRRVLPVAPLVSVITIALVCASTVSYTHLTLPTN